MPICKISFRFLKKWKLESKMYSNGKSVPSLLNFLVYVLELENVVLAFHFILWPLYVSHLGLAGWASGSLWDSLTLRVLLRGVGSASAPSSSSSSSSSEPSEAIALALGFIRLRTGVSSSVFSSYVSARLTRPFLLLEGQGYILIKKILLHQADI